MSVLICNYNHAHYVGDALEAILNQSVKPIEVIVIDDASTDHSVQVLEAFAARDPIIRIVRNERNVGTVAGLNRGMAYATGEYVYCGGADDKVLPGFVEHSLAILREHPDAGFCWSDHMTLDAETGLVNPNRLRLSTGSRRFSPGEIAELLRRGDLPCLSGHSALYRRSAMFEAGGLRSELRWYADQFLATVLALRHGACYVPEILTCARIVPGSWMRAGSQQRQSRRDVFLHVVRLLRSPSYADVYPLAKRSGFLGWYLGVFDLPMLWVSLTRAEYRDYVSGTLVWRTVWYAVKIAVSRVTPAGLRRAYYRKRDWYRERIRPLTRRLKSMDGVGKV